ncbi:MAG: cation transporter [Phycisphaerae bacterium]|nr:cation transporter [Phycisphaerae bacterium]
MPEQPAGAESRVLTPLSVTWAGLAANAVLAGTKIAAGFACRSRAILADGLHSASDLTTDVAVLASLAVASKPADACHPYGHRRVSTMTAMFVGAMLLGAAVWITYDAIVSLQSPHAPVRGLLPLLLAAASVPIKELLFHLTRFVGKRTSNISLLANAWHHRTDAFTSVAAAAGLAGVAFGGERWAFLDHLTAVVLAVLLFVVAVRIMVRSGSELVDRAPSAATLSRIEQALAETSGVKAYHAFRARCVGGKVEMDVHVEVDGSLTVAEGHDIAAAVRRRIREADKDVLQVVVHIEPHQR